MNLLGSTKKVVDKNKDEKNVPKSESAEIVLVHCNLVKNDFQQTLKVFFTFILNKQFGQLINISTHSLTMMKQLILNFLLLNFGLQIKLVKHSKLKIMLI